MAINPTFDYEELYWQHGITFIAGVDEVGIGALAGPVVAAAVILDRSSFTIGVRDSKLTSPKQRESLAIKIKSSATAWAIGEATVAEISALNVLRASHLAMRRAVDQLNTRPDMLLIDGKPAQPHSVIPSINIIDGDALSFSIAAASIIAKVYRDNIMVNLHKDYPLYGFEGHKGYGSTTHLAALNQYGPCPEHRLSYSPVAKALTKLK